METEDSLLDDTPPKRSRFNLTTWALMHHQLVRYLMITLLVAGAYAYTRLGQAEDPDFTWRVMLVKAYWPGATVREVEEQVTERLEKKLQEAPHVDFIESYTKPGETTLFINLREDTPSGGNAESFYQIRKKLGDMKKDLPEGVQGPYANDEFGDTFGSIYAFTGDGYSYAELRKYVDKVRLELLRVNDVAKVNLIGEQPEKIYIEFDNEKLFTAGIDPQAIINALRQQNAIPAPASIETSSDSVSTRISGDFRSVESIREMGIQAGGHTFRLGDVARVQRGYEDPPTFKMRYMGQEAIGLEVSMRQRGDIIRLGESLQQAMARIQADLPLGIEVHQVADQPAVVDHAVDLFMQSLLEAVLIVLAVSFLALGLRAGLVVALSIPLVLSITFIMMWAFGIDLQRVSLGALIISLGLLVDDAMIAVEMMVVRLDRGWQSLKAASYAYTSTAFPMLTGTLVTAAGFMPVGLAKSGAGEYTFSIFAVVTIALLSSWIVAVIFTPYLGFLLLKPRRAKEDRDLYRTPFYNAFRRLVTWCVDWRKTVILLTTAVFFFSLWGFKFVEQQFFPVSDRNEVVVDLWLPEGSTYQATEAEVQRFERRLNGDARITQYTSYVGRGIPHFFFASMGEQRHSNYGAVVITARNNAERDALFHEVWQWLQSDFPNVKGHVSRFENGPPTGYPVQFRVLGEDPAVLRGIADRMAEIMRNHPKTRDIYADWNEIIKTVQLKVDQDKARALGVSSQELGNAINAMLNGQPVTQFREGDQLIDVVVRAGDVDRTRLDALEGLGIRTASGKHVPLAQLVSVRYGFEEGKSWHRNGETQITVKADIADDVQAPEVTMDLQAQMDALEKTLPSGYHIDTGGAYEGNIKSQASITEVFPIMIVTIITLLMLQLQKFNGALRVMLSAPLGIVGVTWALLLFDAPFGFVALLGVVALAGIIMRNSVILVEQIERLMEQSQHPRRAVIEAAVRRLRPILLTAAATILAMIPLMQSTFWRPMAIAMMGGAFVATLLTLIFEPAMYAAWFRIRPAEPIKAKARLDQISGANAMLRAAENGNADTCSILLQHGDSPDAADSEGNSALMLAAQNGHLEVCKVLVAAGANVNLAKTKGTTALMRATMNGHDEVCRLLLAAGANVNARAGNISALDIAQRRGYASVAELLMAAGAD